MSISTLLLCGRLSKLESRRCFVFCVKEEEEEEKLCAYTLLMLSNPMQNVTFFQAVAASCTGKNVSRKSIIKTRYIVYVLSGGGYESSPQWWVKLLIVQQCRQNSQSAQFTVVYSRHTHIGTQKSHYIRTNNENENDEKRTNDPSIELKHTFSGAKHV